MNIKSLQFPNIGVTTGKFTDKELKPLREKILEIQNNFDLAEKHNKELAGNIKKEFGLIKSKDHIDKLLRPGIQDFEKCFTYFSSISVLDSDFPISMGPMWVNFQEKYEFNPVHGHSGVLSFVIWLSLPFNIENEKSQGPGAESANPIAGNFVFYYTNSLGKICMMHIEADSKMENQFFIFPAELKHSVAPFYTSDKYRISVSGNYTFKTLKD